MSWLNQYFWCVVIVFIIITKLDLILENKHTGEVSSINDKDFMWFKLQFALYWIVVLPYLIYKILKGDE